MYTHDVSLQLRVKRKLVLGLRYGQRPSQRSCVSLTMFLALKKVEDVKISTLYCRGYYENDEIYRALEFSRERK